jgi:Zn-dependent peptidase ImmA (M78 family)
MRANNSGITANLKDAVLLEEQRRADLPTNVAAWKRGAAAAHALREQERLETPISDDRLCELAGVPTNTITSAQTAQKSGPLSFILDKGKNKAAIVMRKRYATARRFDLARLIGDRITHHKEGRFFPATEAFTYRQKLQRAFAAELLCPVDALKERLEGDFGSEAIEDAAQHFRVSPYAVQWVLVDHKLLDFQAMSADARLQAA